MSQLRSQKGRKDFLKLVRRNIEINAERANRQYAKENRITEAPDHIKRKHRKMFENAEYERERKE
jgi:hypothetical protein